MKVLTRFTFGFYLSFVIWAVSMTSFELGTGPYSIADYLLIVATGLFIVSMVYIVIYTFRHWGLNSFEDFKTKKRWFWVLLAGTFIYLIGPIFYYLFVIEPSYRGREMRGRR